MGGAPVGTVQPVRTHYNVYCLAYRRLTFYFITLEQNAELNGVLNDSSLKLE